MHHEYRIAITASSLEQVQQLLEADVEKAHNPVSPKGRSIAFAFTGQGSQYAGLAKTLFDVHPGFKSDLQRLDRLALLQGLPSPLALVDGTGDVQKLSPTVIQLGLVSVQVALVRLWASWDVLPSVVIGHSLGEYAALHTAGVLSASDMILLVGRRAQLLESKCTPYTHGMLAVRSGVHRMYCCPSLDEHNIQIACINGPDETILCGKVEDLVPFNEHLTSIGYKTKPLNVPFAFHSEQIAPILDDFEASAAGVSFDSPTLPVLSPLLGQVIAKGTTEVFGPVYLSRHAREAVDFWSALKAAQSQQIVNAETLWVEIGAHPVTSAMIHNTIDGSTVIASLRKDEDPWRTLSTSISTLHLCGCAINFGEVHRPFADALDLYELPRYSFDNKDYWLDYHNDWTLTKGQNLSNQKGKVASGPEYVSKLSTTSCQRVLTEKIDVKSGTATLLVQSDITERRLARVVFGHRLNGTPLCPSSLYADMALTVAQHLYQELCPNVPNDVGFNICQMDVHTLLIAKTPAPDAGQHLQLEATLNLASKEVNLTFREMLLNSQARQLGRGLVRIEKTSYWKRVWSRLRFMVQSQIDLLQEKSETGGAHKILRGMAYKLFAALVDYGKPFRGMEEVTLHSTRPEATAKVRFQTSDDDGTFSCSPYWIDSLAHISGFTVNATDLVDPSSVFVSHGWESIRIAKNLSADSEYRSYVRMLPQEEKDVMAGDVYIMEEGEIIAVILGLKFKKVSRRAFEIMVPPNGGTRPPLLRSQTVSSIPVEIAAAAAMEEKAVDSAMPADNPQVRIDTSRDTMMSEKVMDIVAEETELDLAELVDDAAFENLGVDSLMTLSISAKLREDLGLDVGSTLFTDCSTVGELRRLIDDTYSSSPSASAATEEDSDSQDSVDSATTYGSQSDQKLVERTNFTAINIPGPNIARRPNVSRSKTESFGARIDLSTLPPATSVLLQGNARSSTKRLFLLPDGSGSATSYVSIPLLDPSIVVYGLNCPFLKTPRNMTCNIETLTKLYLKEIQRRQTSGPYLLGGWSAGGVMAYETTRQLILAGEKVEQLLLLDAPCPVNLDPLPARLHVFFDQIGLLGAGKAGGTPSWLLPHFAATVSALSDYAPLPLSKRLCPNVLAVWCTDGVAPGKDDPRPPRADDGKEDPAPMNWLLNNRTDFGDNGWGQLLSREKMQFAVMGGHHFSMMKGDHVS